LRDLFLALLSQSCSKKVIKFLRKSEAKLGDEISVERRLQTICDERDEQEQNKRKTQQKEILMDQK
jgi:hypothetical protein